MMQKIELYNYIYTNLVRIFPNKPWIKSIMNLNGGGSQVTVNRFGDRIFAYGLFKWDNLEKIKCDEYDQLMIADSMFYSNLFIDSYHSLPEKDKIKAKARFEAAFTKSNDMRAIHFELFVLNYLKNNQYEVQSKDNQLTGETFDYLIQRSNGPEIEVECKSFAYDKGLHITADDAFQLSRIIMEQQKSIDIYTDKSVEVITVEMLDAIPNSLNDRDLLAGEVLDAINCESNILNDRFKVHREFFDNVEDIDQVDAHLQLKIQKHGIELARVASCPEGNKGRLCLRVTTRSKNGFWRDFESICKKAAKKQLSKKKPASIAVHIYNIDTLNDFLKDDRFIHKVNNIFNQEHLISLIFFSNISAYENDTYPYFYVSPVVKEFQNKKTKFTNRIKITEGDGGYSLKI